jgi:hypothetical protein
MLSGAMLIWRRRRICSWHRAAERSIHLGDIVPSPESVRGWAIAGFQGDGIALRAVKAADNRLPDARSFYGILCVNNVNT